MHSKRTISNGRGFLLGVLLLMAGGGAGASDVVVEYPGTPPGKGSIECQYGRITLRNAVLSMSWTLGSEGLQPSWLRDEQTGQKIMLIGYVFDIVVPDGLLYPAGLFIPE